MVTEWFIWIGMTVARWFVGLFPEGSPPEFLATVDDKWNSVTAGASGIGVWVDWTYVLVVLTAVLGVYVITFGVKVALKIVAFIPFFGGSG